MRLRSSVTAPLNIQCWKKGLLHLWFPDISPVHDKCSIHNKWINELWLRPLNAEDGFGLCNIALQTGLYSEISKIANSNVFKTKQAGKYIDQVSVRVMKAGKVVNSRIHKLPVKAFNSMKWKQQKQCCVNKRRQFCSPFSLEAATVKLITLKLISNNSRKIKMCPNPNAYCFSSIY